MVIEIYEMITHLLFLYNCHKQIINFLILSLRIYLYVLWEVILEHPIVQKLKINKILIYLLEVCNYFQSDNFKNIPYLTYLFILNKDQMVLQITKISWILHWINRICSILSNILSNFHKYHKSKCLCWVNFYQIKIDAAPS